MENILAYIGTFELETSEMIVCDPYVNGITSYMEKIPAINEASARLTNMFTGVYHAYHLVDGVDGTLLSLIALHSTINIKNLHSKKPSIADKIMVSMGNSVAAVDAKYIYDSSYCYYSFDDHAYYSCDRLLADIPNMPYPSDWKEQLEDLVNKELSSGAYAVKGDKLISILGPAPVWKGFREFKTASSQWSAEIMERLSYSYKNAITIKGGVASRSGSDVVSIYSYHDNGNIYGVSMNISTSN